MGVVSYEAEIECAVPATRMFKAVALDFINLLPKVLPQVVTSAEFLEGDGGVGSIRQIKFGEGTIKERIDTMDEEKLSYSYTVIEGNIALGKFEKITNEMKVEASKDGEGEGSIIKSLTSYYYNAGDHEISEDEIKVAKEQSAGLYKAIEAYLLANPDA